MLKRLYHWTLALAGSPRAQPALGVVSFVESSFFPIPADVLFVPMCAARPEKAMRYALIATVTSVLGGIFGWMLGYFAFSAIGRPLLEFWGKAEAFDTLSAQVSGNFGLVLLLLVTSGLAHLPPMKVVTILSGVVAFSLPLFILSAIVARGARFYALAWLLRRYGHSVVAFIERRLMAVTAGLLALLAALWLVLRYA